MIAGRRGVVFTLMAILVVAFLIASQRVSEGASSLPQQEVESARSRVAMMDSYLETFERQAAASLATAGYFALQNASRKVLLEGDFFPDADALDRTIGECIVNNTIEISGGTHVCLEGNRSMSAGLDQIVLLAQDHLLLDTDYVVHDAWIAEEEPLEVVLYANISYNVTDPVFAKFAVEDAIIRVVAGVEGIEDPLYSYLQSRGAVSVPRIFAPTSFRRFEFNPSVFDEFYSRGSYVVVESMGPSVLQRYLGQTLNTTDVNYSRCCGIESVVRLSDLDSPGGTYVNYSLADHHLASHIRNPADEYYLPPFDCQRGEVRGYDAGEGVAPIESGRFLNIYNLSSQEEPRCRFD